MSQSAKTAQKDAGTIYLESLTHAEKLVESQPSEEDKSTWKKWAKELIAYESKTLSPREKRAPRLTKYSDGAAERFLAVMKVIEATDQKLKSVHSGPSSSGESEPEETSGLRRSTRRSGDQDAGDTDAEKTQPSADTSNAAASAPNFTDAERTINYEIPCTRCARAGIACAGKEGRACFTCRAHRQGCDLSSRAIREKERASGQSTEKDKDARNEPHESASTANGRQSVSTRAKDRNSPTKTGDKTAQGSERISTPEARESRPRRAATLLNNPRVGSPKTVADLRAGSGSVNSSSAQRKRRATDADLSIANPTPPGPSPSKRPRAFPNRPAQRNENHSLDMPDFDPEEVRDALLVCEAAFRQLRKSLRL